MKPKICYLCGKEINPRREYKEVGGRYIHKNLDKCKEGIQALHDRIEKLTEIITYDSFQIRIVKGKTIWENKIIIKNDVTENKNDL